MTTPREDAIAALDAEWAILRNSLSKAYVAKDIDAALATARERIETATLFVAALAAAPETPEPIRSVDDIPHMDVTDEEAEAFLAALHERPGHWLDLDSPEAAEALARAAETVGLRMDVSWWVEVLAAMRQSLDSPEVR